MDSNLWEPLDPSWPLVSEEFQFANFDDDSLSENSSLSPSSDPSRSPSTDSSTASTTLTKTVPAKRGRKVTAVLPRKDRNKASALKYRQRKKEYTGQLETQVAGLVQLIEQQQKELHDLRTENKIMTQQLEFVKSFMASNLANAGVSQPAPPASAPPPSFTPPSLSSFHPPAAATSFFHPSFPFSSVSPPSSLNNKATVPSPRLLHPDASTYYSLLAHPAMYLGLLGCCLILAPTLSSAPTSVTGPRGRVLLSLEGSSEWQIHFNSLALLFRTVSILIFYVGLALVGGVLVVLFGSRVRSLTTGSWINAWRPDVQDTQQR